MERLPAVLSGTVLHGKRLGQEFEIPTANIEPVENIDGLVYGVYASDVRIGERIFSGVTNLGVRPTVEDGEKVNAETFILDYDGDLYGKEITVTLFRFMRKERKFDSVEALMEQIRRDIRSRRSIS